VPKCVLQLYEKIFIFRFKINSQNLTEERQGYVIRKTFIPDDKFKKETSHDIFNEFILDAKVENNEVNLSIL
jgi:hypothetical protein